MIRSDAFHFFLLSNLYSSFYPIFIILSTA
jgi:hypothetical protein